jgi:hypothetical protein
MPEDFTVSPEIAAMCRSEGLPDPYVVLEDFRGKAKAHDYRYVDWEAAYRNWMRSPITRRDYPAWEPDEAPTPSSSTATYGPPVAPPPELMTRLLGLGEKTPAERFAEEAAASAKKSAGGTS